MTEIAGPTVPHREERSARDRWIALVVLCGGMLPLVPLRIFRSRNVSGANLVMTLMAAGLFGMFLVGALYLQRVLGYGALEVGLAFLPVALTIGALSLDFCARLMLRFGARATLLTGLALSQRMPVDGD